MHARVGIPTYRDYPWFLNFAARLLEGSSEVLGLLEENPFPGPPRYVRAQLYNYRFTDWAERSEKGTWWQRELLGPHCLVLSLRRE